MEQISITINGKRIICQAGTSILNASLENGIRIPTLCHHPHLKPFGACRLCIVEEEKTGRILASCVTPVAKNMSIRTETPEIIGHRRNIIRMIMANHPESCIVCNKGNRCELRMIAAELNVGMIDLYPIPYYSDLEAANPFIIRDLSKCILCGRCIRADHELVMVGAIDYNLRSFPSRPATVHERPLERSSCTFCGTCVSMCPTGALMAKNSRFAGSPAKEINTVCGFCAMGCSLVIGTVDSQVVEANPSHEPDTVNRSALCVRGHFAHDFLNSSKRLTEPLIRKNGHLSPSTWDEAMDLMVDKLLTVKKQYGPQSVAFFGSSKCSLEENYLFQKIARVLLGTNNMDNGGYLSGRPVLARIHERLQGNEYTPSLRDLEYAEAVLVIGANPTHSLPVLGYSLKRISRKEKKPVILMDPRKTELVPFSTLWLPVAPQSDLAVINGLAAILFKRGKHHLDFINGFTEGFGQYSSALSSLDLDRVCRLTGLEEKMLEKAAELLGGKRIAFVIGHGICQQPSGFQAIDAIINLALMTGSIGKKGTGFYLLAKENNERGAWDMGTIPDFLPGRQSIRNDSLRRYWEQVWHTKLSPDPGLNIIRMVEEAEKGNLKALYIMGENPIRSLPQQDRVRRALVNLEFLAVQDILDNETVRAAHVVLPAAAFSEKEGSFTNLEGRIQAFDPALSPPGLAKPDWEILDLLGRRLGFTQGYRSIQRIRDEIGRLVPMYSELKRNGRVGWIKQGIGGDALISFQQGLSMEKEIVDPDYPMKAMIGSSRYHLGSGTRTSCSDRIREFERNGKVEIPLNQGKDLGIQDGDRVRISSPHGAIEREVKLERDLMLNIVFVPKAVNGNDVMNLLPLVPLEGPNSTGFKMVEVRIEKL
ncbi:MAG: molybdopterin-dependent oxidoreductase [Pseudomonadota bacterium]